MRGILLTVAAAAVLAWLLVELRRNLRGED